MVAQNDYMPAYVDIVWYPIKKTLKGKYPKILSR